MNYFTNPDATIAYKKGIEDGTINETIEDIYFTVMDQEVVSFSSEKGTYTFDYFDFQEGE